MFQTKLIFMLMLTASTSVIVGLLAILFASVYEGHSGMYTNL